MDREIVISMIAFLGTIIGSAGGILASSKLTNHRIQELEKRVEKHNNLVARTYVLEATVSTLDSRLNKIEGGN